MASARKEITRRDFASRGASAAAAVVAGGAALSGAKAAGAPAVSARMAGANDRLVFAVIGIRGQGNSLKRGFARLPGVEIKTLCDPDENLFPSRAKDDALADLPTFKARPLTSVFSLDHRSQISRARNRIPPVAGSVDHGPGAFREMRLPVADHGPGRGIARRTPASGKLQELGQR